MSSESGADHWLAHTLSLIPAASNGAMAVKWFPGRWRTIAGTLDKLPSSLSDLSTHPFFSRHPLCAELLQSISAALSDVPALAARCASDDPPAGKLRTQSDLDALAGRLGVGLRDCSLLVKTGVLSDPVPAAPSVVELLARVQIGDDDAKQTALDGLLDSLRENEKSVVGSLGRRQISAVVHLLSAASPRVKEKAASFIASLAESGSCDSLLVSEGVLSPLISLAGSGSLVGREKAMISLHRLSISADNARSIVELRGVRPLLEACVTGDSISQSSAAGAMKNLSAIPEVRQSLVEDGVIGIMINLLDCGTVLVSKEYAAECLQNLSSGNESLRRAVVSGGGVRSLLCHLDGPLPQESAVTALKNIVGLVSISSLMAFEFLPRLAHVFKQGSPGAQQAAASAICIVSGAMEVKKSVGEFGILAILVRMLDAKENRGREVAAQAIASLISYPGNRREIKKDEKSIPNLVQLLNPSPQNSATKYAVSCLLHLSSSKKCRKLMISYGGIGYLKKLLEVDVPGSKKLVEQLERRKIRTFFGRK